MNAAETSQTLGEFLRHERERRGMTIEQVASATKINIRMLHALEADHFADLPAKPFVRGFVTSYCRFIGLAPKEILTRFGGFIDDKAHDRPNRDAGHSGYAFEKREGEQSRTVLWFAMGGFIAVGALVFIFLKPSLHHHHSTHLDKLRNAHPEEGTPSDTPVAAATTLPPGSSGSLSAATTSGTVALPQAVASPGAPPFVGPVRPTSTVATADSYPPAAVPTPQTAETFSAGNTPQAVQTPAPVATTTAVASPAATAAPANDTTATPSPASDTAAAPAKSATAAADPGIPPGLGIEVEPASTDDPLASGVTLKRSEIQHKVVIKAGDDVWVRYRVDGKPVMRFILRKSKVLVLRARKAIRFQASDPDAMTFNYNGQGSNEMTSRAFAAKQQNGDMTLYFPSDLSKIINEPFPGEKPIQGKSVPPPRAPAPASTTSP